MARASSTAASTTPTPDLVAFLGYQAAGQRLEADALALRYRLKLLKGSEDRELEASPFGKDADVRVIWKAFKDELVLELRRSVPHRDL